MPPRAAPAAFALTLAVAALLRLPTLDLQSYWLDEAFTVTIVRESLGHVLDSVPETELTPPLYYLAAWAWGKLFGLGEVGLRSLSALAGIGAVAAVYVAGRNLVDVRAGLAAAALVAVNPFFVWYSQEARSYALVTLFGALTVMFGALELREPGRRRWLAGWGLAAGAAICTHYFAVFLLAPQAAWLLWRRKQAEARIAVAAVAGVGLALLPLALYQEKRALLGFLDAYPFTERVGDSVTQLAAGREQTLDGVPLEALLWLGGLLVAGWKLNAMDIPRRRGVALATVLALLTIALPLSAAALGADYVVPRNFLVALPPLAIAVGAGLASRPAKAVGAGSASRLANAVGGALLAAILVISVATVIRINADPELQRSDWREAAERLGPQRPDRAIVLDSFGLPTFDVYRDTSRIPAEGALVTELVYVMRESAPIPRPPGPYELAGREAVNGLVLLTFQSKRPDRVGNEELVTGDWFIGAQGHSALDLPG